MGKVVIVQCDVQDIERVVAAMSGVAAPLSRRGDETETPAAPPPAVGEVPPPAVGEVPFAGESRRVERIADGYKRFAGLVRVWIVNFGVPEAPQPARVEEAMATFQGFNVGAVYEYIEDCGGLTGAINNVLVREGLADVHDALDLAKRIALNLVQVGSAMGLPLDRYIEASLMFGSKTAEGPMLKQVEPEENRPHNKGMRVGGQ